MKKIMKRLLTGVLTLATVFTALPVTQVHAADSVYTTTDGKAGTIVKIDNGGSEVSSFEESIMNADGQIAYCIDINTNFQSGYKNRINATERMSDDQISDVALNLEYVKQYAEKHSLWSNTQESIDKRTAAINNYLTKSLQDLNVDTVRQDIPTSSTVTDVKIWDIGQAGTDDFTVVYSVDQTVTEGETSIGYTSAYMVVVHVDSNGNMVITQNPTISSTPTKSSYEPKTKESDGTVDAATTEEVTEFLETFFKLYPTATEKELL